MATPTDMARHYLRRMASDLALIGPAQRDIEREGRMVKQGIVARLDKDGDWSYWSFAPDAD